jgi:hypothetical protein
MGQSRMDNPETPMGTRDSEQGEQYKKTKHNTENYKD